VISFPQRRKAKIKNEISSRLSVIEMATKYKKIQMCRGVSLLYFRPV
jgi:hypothetical protein